MLFRILPAAASALAGVIVIAVSAASAAPPDDDPGADAASSPVPELMVAPPTDYPDVRLFDGDAFSGQAAFNPVYPNRLVVSIGSPGAPVRCYVKRSADGGRTWGHLVQLPQLADAQCWYVSPALTYAAGGGRLYAAYVYKKPDPAEPSQPCLQGVAVSVSTDQGTTWSTPTGALPEVDTCQEEYLVDVRLAAAPDGSRVYVAAGYSQYYRGAYGASVFFSSSNNHGLSWTPVKKIPASFPEYDTFLRGFALAAGRGGNVFIAYGWEEYHDTGYNYMVQVARSADHGASFLYGTAEWSDDYMGYPDIKIGPFGTAHLVYGKGWNQGAILYKYSFPPYGSWSAEAVRLDDDVPQAYVGDPHLAVGACGPAGVLHATWAESLDVSDYRTSKVLYTRKVAQPGYAWSEPLKIGTLNYGISNSELAAAGPKAFSIFSGRTTASLDVIAGSRVSSGVTCP